jgi:formate hydrogenlyase transcriptional activator
VKRPEYLHSSSDPHYRPRELEQLIGNSRTLEEVLEAVERVAPTSSTVFIRGETGTGKELIARAIHNISPRRGCPFIKLSCAALPLDLLESELFGYEKGAFTGAIAQKLGRFELADKGTLFLDEVGDLPLVLQPKLLRILQEREFERLGSNRTQRVDVRLVAATHQDLAEMVRNGQFRSDLYFRLNVFPVLLPPLRERREDIPALVTHFVERLGPLVGREICHIPTETMLALSSYDWPGNVRELQNLIERAMILSVDGVLPNPLVTAATQRVSVLPTQTTLMASERALILRTLEAVGWVIGGRDGAAARLGLKRTTLIYKMQRHGIFRSSLASDAETTESPSQTPSLPGMGIEGSAKTRTRYRLHECLASQSQTAAMSVSIPSRATTSSCREYLGSTLRIEDQIVKDQYESLYDFNLKPRRSSTLPSRRS